MSKTIKMPGNAIINAVIKAAAIGDVLPGKVGAKVFVWQANAAEQIEAALRDQGYRLARLYPTSKNVVEMARQMAWHDGLSYGAMRPSIKKKYRDKATFVLNFIPES